MKLDSKTAHTILAGLRLFQIQNAGLSTELVLNHDEIEALCVKLNQVGEPPALDEDQLAAFMLQRIENGDLGLEDIPVRLARYGLMEPEDFVAEMQERMEQANEEDESPENLVATSFTVSENEIKHVLEQNWQDLKLVRHVDNITTLASKIYDELSGNEIDTIKKAWLCCANGNINDMNDAAYAAIKKLLTEKGIFK